MPYLTTNLPGIGGQLKANPEDFRVEEIPLYLPSGEGQHIYVEIEKRRLSTFDAIRQLAQALKISPNLIGYAGMKDSYAITRQTLSIDNIAPETLEQINLPNVKILSINRHRNKLKIGHLKANRFILRVCEVEETVLPQAEAILTTLAAQGVPNFFGEQRFGNRGNTHRLGHLLVRHNEAEFISEYLGRPQPHEFPDVQAARQLVDEGQWEAALAKWPQNLLTDERRMLASIVKAQGQLEGITQWLSSKLKTFFISAFQSQLFNELLTQRLATLTTLEWGDVAYIHRNGAAFVVEDVATEQPRADAFEISPSGPLFGTKTLMPQGEPGQREQAMLDQHDLTLEHFKLPGLKLRGERRPYRFPLTDPKVWWDDGLMLSFELPPGTYATTVMAEVMKPSLASSPTDSLPSTAHP